MKADIDGTRIRLTFPYSEQDVRLVKTLPGRRYDADRRSWVIPLGLKSARLLHETFGARLEPSPALKAWSKKAVREERRLRRKVVANDAPLVLLRQPFVDYLRPYQRADVAFMAERSCVNANQAGLGKTNEVIAAVQEAGLEHAPNLVIAPVTSLESVWAPEIARWTCAPTFAGTTRAQRGRALYAALAQFEAGNPGWLMLNPEMLKQPAVIERVAAVAWGAVAVDEFHTMGLSNTKTLLTQALAQLKADRKWPLSGSPVSGVPLKLWAALHWVAPKDFPSRWHWAEQWLTKETTNFGTSFGGIQIGREDEFYKAHAPWLIRRLKSEVAPELPPKTYRDVWVDMRPAQARQYKQFIDDGEIRLSGERLIATNRLAEDQHLKLFAFGSVKLDNGKLHPTTDSPKLDALLDRIAHHEGEPTLVFSQFRRVVDLLHEHFQVLGFKTAKLTGETKNRAQVVRDFQAGHIHVLFIVTKAAGVSVTLDRADSVHVLDQTWNPDDQDQAEDRAHRISRVHNVTVYQYRTRNTIEEWIAQLNLEKQKITASILDKYRAELVKR